MAKKQNGKSLFARGPHAGGPDGVRASKLTRDADGCDCIDCAQDRLHSPDFERMIKQTEKDSGMRDGVTTEERHCISTLERENCELRQANQILRKASAHIAQAELDRPLKR